MMRRGQCLLTWGRLLHGGVDRNSCFRTPTARSTVASFTGAWIETPDHPHRRLETKGRLLHGGVDRNEQSTGGGANKATSPPSRGRGSKHLEEDVLLAAQVVASFTGAWIETPAMIVVPDPLNVASFTGAWIETPKSPSGSVTFSSRLLHGGLDRNITHHHFLYRCPRRLLHGGVDRNLANCWDIHVPGRRLLHGGVDRNYTDLGKGFKNELSPPSRGRGSKRLHQVTNATHHPRRLLHGGVDRNLGTAHDAAREVCRLLHGGVDRNSGAYQLPGRSLGRLLHGGVDRNAGSPREAHILMGRLLHGGVDRNRIMKRLTFSKLPSPPSRGRG